jgi:divalent metal cation (Fe/Co/Zn/Cd) transporter
VLAVYLLATSASALVSGHRATPSILGIGWTAVTAIVMFQPSRGKSVTVRALDNPVLSSEGRGSEGRVTFIDGLLAVAVLIGVALDLLLGWWWADPLAGVVIV